MADNLDADSYHKWMQNAMSKGFSHAKFIAQHADVINDIMEDYKFGEDGMYELLGGCLGGNRILDKDEWGNYVSVIDRLLNGEFPMKEIKKLFVFNPKIENYNEMELSTMAARMGMRFGILKKMVMHRLKKIKRNM